MGWITGWRAPQKALHAWKERLGKKGSGSRSSRTTERRIDRILAAQFLKQVLSITYDGSKTEAERLTWAINHDAYRHLCDDYFGKRILITNREGWSSDEIIAAYRGQSQVENTLSRSRMMSTSRFGRSSTGRTRRSTCMPSFAWLLSCLGA